jgi:hypothetical protein
LQEALKLPGVLDAYYDYCQEKIALYPGWMTLGVRFQQDSIELEKCYSIRLAKPSQYWRRLIFRPLKNKEQLYHIKKWTYYQPGFIDFQRKKCEDQQKRREEFQKNYPQSEYIYFFVGHSLAGMLIDLFLKNKLGEAGFSYNPAILDYSNDNHYRIYSSSDEILYKLFSAKDASNVEVRKTPKKGFLQTLASFTLGNLPTSLKLHLLNTDSIKGGRIMFS